MPMIPARLKPETVKSVSAIDLIHCESSVYQKASLNLAGEAAFFNKTSDLQAIRPLIRKSFTESGESEKNPSGVVVELSPEAFSRFDAKAKADLLSYAACGDSPRARFLAFLQNTENTVFRDSIQGIEIKGESVKPSFLYECCKTKVLQAPS